MPRTKKIIEINPEQAAAARDSLLSAREQAKRAKEEHGNSIHLSIQRGNAIAKQAFGAELLTMDLGKAMSSMVNDNLSITPTGLLVAEGYEPTEQEVTEAVAGLCGIKEEGTKFNTTLSFAMGDAAILADKFEGGVERVVNQAIREKGASKHSVLQAIRVCRAFSHPERMEGASFSHHMEILNYREGIQDKDALAAIVGELKDSIQDGDPMSCATLREKLSAISTGNRKKPKEEVEQFEVCPKCGFSMKNHQINGSEVPE